MLVASTPDSTENNGTAKQVAVNKTLVLFEDADTVFKEDRGFISTILQLVDSTKWPIVLTSNSKFFKCVIHVCSKITFVGRGATHASVLAFSACSTDYSHKNRYKTEH